MGLPSLVPRGGRSRGFQNHVALREAGELDITIHLGGEEETLKAQFPPSLGPEEKGGSRGGPGEQQSDSRARVLWEAGPALIACKLPHRAGALAQPPVPICTMGAGLLAPL